MWGYGLRYQYGIFRQLLDQNLAQVEAVDPWLDTENPWEITRNDVKYAVRFYGTVDKRGGKGKAVWYGGQEVLAVAYDVPIPGGSKQLAQDWILRVTNSLPSHLCWSSFRALTPRLENSKRQQHPSLVCQTDRGIRSSILQRR